MNSATTTKHFASEASNITLVSWGTIWQISLQLRTMDIFYTTYNKPLRLCCAFQSFITLQSSMVNTSIEYTIQLGSYRKDKEDMTGGKTA